MGIPSLLTLVIFVVLGLLRLISLMQRAQQPPARRPPPAANPPGDPSVQEEIDEFLRRVSGGRGQARPAAGQSARPETPVTAEVVDETAAEPVGAQVGKQVETYLDTGEFSRRTSQLGGEVAQADEEIGHRLKQVFGHDVSQLAKKPGEAAAPPAADETALAPAALPLAGLIEMLANADGVRQAIVISEVLRRPEDRWD